MSIISEKALLPEVAAPRNEVFIGPMRDIDWPEIANTHPWLTFRLDLRRADWRLWESLGEVRAYIDTLTGMPLLPELQERLYTVYLAKGALATTAIEGNTLTDDQALAQVRGELRLPSSQEYLGREIQNVVDACNQVRDEVAGEVPPPLTPERIAAMHAMVLTGDVPVAAGTVPGRYRSPGHEVVVSGVGYRGVPGRYVAALMARLCAWLNGDDFLAERTALEIPYGLLRAIVAHLYVAWIHPFGDGNGRTARLLEFDLLLRAGVPDVACNLLSDHYNKTRSDYYRHLNEASRSGGDVLPFLTYAARGFADDLQEQVAQIKDQQLKMTFESHVRSRLRQTTADRAERQRLLVMALAERLPDAVPVADARYLTPDLGRRYEGMTTKAVTRDLNELKRLGLVISPGRNTLAANVEALAAFMPASRRQRP